MLYYFHFMLLRRRRVVVYSALECLYSHSQVQVQAAKSGPAIVHRIEGSCAVEKFLFVYMLFVDSRVRLARAKLVEFEFCAYEFSRSQVRRYLHMK